MPGKLIGIEQVGDRVIHHRTRDFRPMLAGIAWIVIMVTVMLMLER